MNKIFIIAGTSREADLWIKNDCDKRWHDGDTSVSKSDYVYVTNADRLRGYTNPHGRFVGNWRGRPDIVDIIQTLISRTMPANGTLIQLLHEISGHPAPVRPTPKIHGKTATQVYIDEAASIMAKEIDAEVIKQFNGGDMTNRYNEVRKAMESLMRTTGI